MDSLRLYSLQSVLQMWSVVSLAWWWLGGTEALGAPLLGPEIMSFGSLPRLSLWHSGPYPIIPTAPLQSSLPAPKGTDFDGPDPGLNPAIITVPREPCPSGYRRDFNDMCRLKFGYGPNPFFSFTPEKFKGDVQFYMGLQVGGPGQTRRRGRGRRPRPRVLNVNSVPNSPSDDDDD